MRFAFGLSKMRKHVGSMCLSTIPRADSAAMPTRIYIEVRTIMFTVTTS